MVLTIFSKSRKIYTVFVHRWSGISATLYHLSILLQLFNFFHHQSDAYSLAKRATYVGHEGCAFAWQILDSLFRVRQKFYVFLRPPRSQQAMLGGGEKVVKQ